MNTSLAHQSRATTLLLLPPPLLVPLLLLVVPPLRVVFLQYPSKVSSAVHPKISFAFAVLYLPCGISAPIKNSSYLLQPINMSSMDPESEAYCEI